MLLQINSKLLIRTVVFVLNLAQYETFSAYKYENANSWHFLYLAAEKILCSAEFRLKTSFITSGPELTWISKSTLSITDMLTLSVRFYVLFNSISDISGR